MIEFHKYPKMKNSYAEQVERFGDMEMYSSEKIDGSNTQITIHYDSEGNYTVLVGSRNRYIDKDCKEALGRVWNWVPEVVSAINTSKLLKENFGMKELKNITFYTFGEIYGASIQTTGYNVTKEGKNDYRIFDCFVKYDETPMVTQLGICQLQSVFGSLVTPPKHVGTLKDLLEIPLDKESEYGAPLEEGEVYHPANTHVYSSWEQLSKFPYNVKRKHKEFSEISRKYKKSKAPKVFTEEQKKLLDELTQYITERRVENILSHGDIERSPKNIGKLIGATISDSMEEFAIDHNIPKEDLKPFGKSIGGVAGQVVRKVVLGNED